MSTSSEHKGRSDRICAQSHIWCSLILFVSAFGTAKKSEQPTTGKIVAIAAIEQY